ncbi:MAG: YARHG domain-containing protein [Bacteroidetes bacterium]|nr:YARHG domain-containing protein [Bacteroidota bacterium]
MNVRFHFWNPEKKTVTLPVGFVVPRGGGDYGYDDYNRTAVSLFTTQVNGALLSHRLYERACDTCSLRDTVIIPEGDGGIDPNGGGPEHVFLSKMSFKPGLNVVTHSYRQRLSMGMSVLSEFYYILTTAKHWAGQVIDTFECDIAPTRNVVCFIDGMDALPRPTLVGIGALAPHLLASHAKSDFSVFEDMGDLAIRIIDATIHFRATSFKPRSNLAVRLFDRVRFQYPSSGNPFDPDRKHPHLYDIYAGYGFVFKDAKVQRWYERQPWYIADPNCTPESMQLTEQDRESVKDLLNDHRDDPAIYGRPPLKRK